MIFDDVKNSRAEDEGACEDREEAVRLPSAAIIT